MADGRSRDADACVKSVLKIVLMLCAASALAQQQVGGMGQIDRSVTGGADRGIRADAARSSAASSSSSFGGKGEAGRTWGAASSAIPGRAGWGTPSRGESGGMASWSPTREAARARAGAVLSMGPAVGSLQNKQGEARIVKKENGVKPPLPPGGAPGPEVKPGPFEFTGFAGRGHRAYRSSRAEKESSREKLAKKFRGPGSPVPVSKRKKKHQAMPSHVVQAHEDQGCEDSSKLKLCTWLSPQ